MHNPTLAKVAKEAYPELEVAYLGTVLTRAELDDMKQQYTTTYENEVKVPRAVSRGALLEVAALFPNAKRVVCHFEAPGAWEMHDWELKQWASSRVSELVLVHRSNVRQAFVFARAADLVAGVKDVELTLSSHPGLAAMPRDGNVGQHAEWHYVLMGAGDVQNGRTSKATFDGTWIQQSGENRVLDVAFVEFKHGTACNFVGGPSDEATRNPQIHCRKFTVNVDGTISPLVAKSLVLGIDQAPTKPIQESTGVDEETNKLFQKLCPNAKLIPQTGSA